MSIHEARPGADDEQQIDADRHTGRAPRVAGRVRFQLGVVLVLVLVAAGALGSTMLAERRAEVRASEDATTLTRLAPLLVTYQDATQAEMVAAVGDDAGERKKANNRTDEAQRRLFAALGAETTDENPLPPDTPLGRYLESLVADNAEARTTLRSGADTGTVHTAALVRGYGQVSDMLSELPLVVSSGVADDALAQALVGLSHYSRYIDAVHGEAELTSLLASGAGGVAPADVVAAIVATDQAERALAATTTAFADGIYQPRDPAELEIRRTALASGGDSLAESAGGLAGSADRYLSALPTRQTVADHVSALAEATLDAQQDRFRNLLVLLGILAVIAIASVVVVTAFVVRPLEALTRTTIDLTERLPELIAAPDEEANRRAGRPSTRGSTEVVELAQGVQRLTESALDLARRQSHDRRAQSHALETVARRQSTLVSKQLSLLDRYEREESDPVVLNQLFSIDHVATLMRRSAESLLVIAGAPSTRRIARPVHVVDVVRGAISEVDDYQRVDVTTQVQVAVAPHIALRATHVLAELIDNATRFSPPHTRVTVDVGLGGGGVRFTITDRGLGIEPDLLADLRRRMAEPGYQLDRPLDQLGLMAVATLAHELGATVELESGQGTTTATVTFPLRHLVLQDGAVGSDRPYSEAFPAWAPRPEADADLVERRPSIGRLLGPGPADRPRLGTDGVPADVA